MTYEEFFDIVKEECSLYTFEKKTTYGKQHRYVGSKDLTYTNWPVKKWNELVFINSWCSGGMTGGSCYGGEPHSRTPDPKPNFDDLDTVMTKLCPEISFLKYKAFMASLPIQETGYGIYEYYGNSSEYTTEYVTLMDLCNSLEEAKIITLEK